MRNDYATIGACATGLGANGMSTSEALQKMQALANQSVGEKGAPEQPLLSEMYDRLQRVSGGLIDARCRIEIVTDRVLGPTPAHPGTANGSASPSNPPAAEVLIGLISSIALQVKRLHEVASRVERIG